MHVGKRRKRDIITRDEVDKHNSLRQHVQIGSLKRFDLVLTSIAIKRVEDVASWELRAAEGHYLLNGGNMFMVLLPFFQPDQYSQSIVPFLRSLSGFQGFSGP